MVKIVSEVKTFFYLKNFVLPTTKFSSFQLTTLLWRSLKTSSTPQTTSHNIHKLKLSIHFLSKLSIFLWNSANANVENNKVLLHWIVSFFQMTARSSHSKVTESYWCHFWGAVFVCIYESCLLPFCCQLSNYYN